MNRDDPKWKGKTIEESSSRALVPGHRGRLIPGPAGIVQMAMERRAVGEVDMDINTQEAIHRALTVESADTDFVDNSAWLIAVSQGYLQDPRYTDLATVKRMRKVAKVPLIVALVKSCVFNELEDPLLELKDPTGCVWATVHHKVTEDKEFAGIVTAGTCLILKDIVVFLPAPKTPYLNITWPNVESVITKSMLD